MYHITQILVEERGHQDFRCLKTLRVSSRRGCRDFNDVPPVLFTMEKLVSLTAKKGCTPNSGCLTLRDSYLQRLLPTELGNGESVVL